MATKMQTAEKPGRRMAVPGSGTWHAMLDAAEAVLRDEGHAALTSRAVAERLGVKQRLVYYYFQSMDELVTAMFHRLSERELARIAGIAASDAPLRGIWDLSMHTTDPRLISEFMALASRIEGLQQEVIHFIEASREAEVAMVAAALERHPQASTLSPQALAIIASSVALTLTREQQIGISAGHAEVAQVIEAFLARAEPASN